jgi:hypothetical protein
MNLRVKGDADRRLIDLAIISNLYVSHTIVNSYG